MEKHYIRTMPLGKDRFHNRFWFFFREGRLFVESDDCKRWGYYSAKEEVTAFQVSVVRNIPLILLIFCCLPLSMIFSFCPLCTIFNKHFVYVQLDALFNSLNIKGIREKALHKQMETVYGKIRLVASLFLNLF
jgi:hypothetical protein